LPDQTLVRDARLLKRYFPICLATSSTLGAAGSRYLTRKVSSSRILKRPQRKPRDEAERSPPRTQRKELTRRTEQSWSPTSTGPPCSKFPSRDDDASARAATLPSAAGGPHLSGQRGPARAGWPTDYHHALASNLCVPRTALPSIVVSAATGNGRNGAASGEQHGGFCGLPAAHIRPPFGVVGKSEGRPTNGERPCWDPRCPEGCSLGRAVASRPSMPE
jgi:hypothetical protein